MVHTPGLHYATIRSGPQPVLSLALGRCFCFRSRRATFYSSLACLRFPYHGPGHRFGQRFIRSSTLYDLSIAEETAEDARDIQKQFKQMRNSKQ